MLKIKSYICWIITTLVLVSCEKEIDTSMLWGKTDYYTDFMFYEYEPVRMTKTICFDANEDSKGHVRNVRLSIFKMRCEIQSLSFHIHIMLDSIFRIGIPGKTI